MHFVHCTSSALHKACQLKGSHHITSQGKGEAPLLIKSLLSLHSSQLNHTTMNRPPHHLYSIHSSSYLHQIITSQSPSSATNFPNCLAFLPAKPSCFPSLPIFIKGPGVLYCIIHAIKKERYEPKTPCTMHWKAKSPFPMHRAKDQIRTVYMYTSLKRSVSVSWVCKECGRRRVVMSLFWFPSHLLQGLFLSFEWCHVMSCWERCRRL